MEFKIDGETFHTQNMVSIEVDGIYLTVYLAPQKHRAFLQRFDDERGIVIQPTTAEQTDALLSLYNQTTLPDISSQLAVIRDIVAPRAVPEVYISPDDSGIAVPFDDAFVTVQQNAFRARR